MEIRGIGGWCSIGSNYRLGVRVRGRGGGFRREECECGGRVGVCLVEGRMRVF